MLCGTILGVSYPVMTTLSALEALGAAEAESEDALAEAGNYAYYIYDAADYESDDGEEEDDTETSGPGGSMGGSMQSCPF